MDESLLTGESVLTGAQSPGGNGGTGVASVTAGVGISVGGTATNPIVTNTGATSVSAADNRVTSSPTTGAVVVGQRMVADWALGSCRYFAVDAVNGNDANAGFASTAAAAGAAAKKTLTAISEIIPPNGAGRVAQLYIANGGVNTAQTYAEVPQFLQQLDGYALFGVCATGTNSNAGAVAFDGTSATDTYAGGITVPGLNAGGYNPTGAPTTTVVQMVKNGGGAPTLPAEPAAPLGWRIRFDIATSTVALRGICKTIVKVSGGDTVTLNTALSTAPSAADVFYIEKAGVLLSNAFVGIAASSSQTISIIGVDCTASGSLFIYSGRPQFGFCGCNGLFIQEPVLLNSTRSLSVGQSGGTGSNRAVGGGLRNAGTTQTLGFGGGRVSLTGYTAVGIFELHSIGNCSINDGSTIAGGLAIQGPFGSAQQSDASDALGSTGTVVPVRFIAAGTNVGFTAGAILRGTRLCFRNCDFTNMGAHPAIQLIGQNVINIAAAISGSTGNTDVGLDLTQAVGSIITLNATPTVTGTAGDIRLADGTIVTWASVVATGIIDSSGNQIITSLKAPVATVKSFSGVIITDAGAATHGFLTDVGFTAVAIAGNEASPIGYPTSARMITRLRGCSPLGTGAQPPTFTLYKNGVATAMTVTLPASTAGIVTAVDSAHPIHFADGDVFDVRADFAATAEGNQPVSATLEGPC